MLRLARLVAVMLVASGGAAVAQETGRYQIVTAPLNVAGEQSSTVLIDTVTGRTWQAVLDDKGRPRWRGIEFAGGSQSIAELPPAPGTQPPPEADSDSEP
jgi:hypothetical protein